MDEPESALSPKRQLELLRVLHTIQGSASAQIIMATHSPILMAVSGARLLEITPAGLAETELRDTRHFKLYRDFTRIPTISLPARCATRYERRRERHSPKSLRSDDAAYFPGSVIEMADLEPHSRPLGRHLTMHGRKDANAGYVCFNLGAMTRLR
ncbi:hypothetical protein ACVIDN_004875 [Rhizobium brockwellii]